jgi:hypothetical protein
VENVEGNLREFVDDLRDEWKLMWKDRVDDKVRAEAIADRTYERLFVDRGLILFATRDYKPPDFQDILERHLNPEEVERVDPNHGIGKFIREHITAQNKSKSRRRQQVTTNLEKMKSHQQLKHRGKGWLHLGITIR